METSQKMKKERMESYFIELDARQKEYDYYLDK